MENKRPRMTITLITINVVIYILMLIAGGASNINVLLEFGAKDNGLIIAGQAWRLFTAMFVHLSLQHIVLNMVTLYFLGAQIEWLFGPIRFIIIYVLSGIGGNIASFAFNPAISAGASTALFGLFGAFLMLGESFRNNPYIHSMAKQFLVLVILNLVFDLMESSIDIWGHLGGLVSGFLLGYIVSVPRLGKVKISKRIIAFIALSLVFVLGYLKGMRVI